MPYEVSQLLMGLGQPVTAEPNEPVQDALDRMLRYSYSQLPVVKGSDQFRQFYFITHETILLALHDFGIRSWESGLRVKDALVRVPNVYRSSDNLFELLAAMRETNAALIVDDDKNLTHVVTTYDTTQYFRQWAEDIMHARDVEHSLKQFITYAFKKASGEIDEQARQATIEELTSSNKDLRKKFEKALRKYLTQLAAGEVSLNPEWAGRAFIDMLNVGNLDIESIVSDDSLPDNSLTTSISSDSSLNILFLGQKFKKAFDVGLTSYLHQQAASDATLNEIHTEAAFSILYNSKEKVRPFNELTLESYVRLFLHEHCWDRCSNVFGIEKTAVDHMLSGVRDTRNKLAHFREEEITTQQRLQLQKCADWLGDLEKSVRAALEASAPESLLDSVVPSAVTSDTEDCTDASNTLLRPNIS